MADKQRLTQAVMQLAQNAVQHTEDGDEIGLGAFVSEQEVRLWVRDSGLAATNSLTRRWLASRPDVSAAAASNSMSPRSQLTSDLFFKIPISAAMSPRW